MYGERVIGDLLLLNAVGDSGPLRPRLPLGPNEFFCWVGSNVGPGNPGRMGGPRTPTVVGARSLAQEGAGGTPGNLWVQARRLNQVGFFVGFFELIKIKFGLYE